MVRRFLYLRLLRGTLVVGALYDLGFAFLLVAVPQVPSRLLRVPLPTDAFWVQLVAVFLLTMGFLYAIAAREPRRYSGVIAAAVGSRALAAVVLGAAAWERADLAGLWPVAGIDLAFALAIGGLWGVWRR